MAGKSGAAGRVLDLESNDDTITQAEDIEDTLLSEFGASPDDVNFSIRVCAVSSEAKHGMPEEYLFTIDRAELPTLWDRIRDGYGSGLYRAHVFKIDGGKKFKFRQFDLPIRAPAKPTAPVASNSEMAMVLQSMERVMERLDKSPAVAAPSVDPVALFEKAMTTVATMMGAMGGQRQNNTPAPSSPAPSMDTMIAMVDRGIELGKTIGAGGADDFSFGGFMKELIKAPEVQGAIGNVISNIAASRTTAPNGGTPIPPPTPRPQVTDHQPNDPRVILTHNLNYLVGKAASNKPIPLYADWFLDNTPAEIVDQLAAVPNLLDMLCEQHPGVKANREWFSNFIDDVRAQVQPASEPEASHLDGVARNDSETAAHGGANTDPVT